mgnify:CR=1 FL=1
MQVSTGINNICVIEDVGVVCWGDNSYGQTDVPILQDPIKVSVGSYFICALDVNGVSCWGDNTQRQIEEKEIQV